MSEPPTFPELLRQFIPELTKAFAGLTKRLISEYGDDLCMIGLACPQDLGYISPIVAIRSKLSKCPPDELFSYALFEYQGAGDKEFKKVDKISLEIMEHRDHPQFDALFYEALLKGMEKAGTAARLIRNGTSAGLVALVTVGDDSENESMLRRLNPQFNFDQMFPTAEWETNRSVVRAGPELSRATPWQITAVTPAADLLFCAAAGAVWEYNLKTDSARMLFKVGRGAIYAMDRSNNKIVYTLHLAVECRDATTFRRLWRTKIQGTLESVSLSPAGEFFVAVHSFSHRATIWSMKSGAFVAELTLNAEGQFTCARWSPNGRFIATSSRDGTVRLWNADSYQLVRELEKVGDRLRFPPDRNELAITAKFFPKPSKLIRIYNIRNDTWREIGETQLGGIDALTFSQDGSHLLAATRYKGLEVFTRSGKSVATFATTDPVHFSHFIDKRTLLLAGRWGYPPRLFLRWQFRTS